MFINDIMRDVNPILKGSYLLMAYDVIIIHTPSIDERERERHVIQ